MISRGLIFSGHNESDLRIKEAFPGVRRFVGVSFPRRGTETRPCRSPRDSVYCYHVNKWFHFKRLAKEERWEKSPSCSHVGVYAFDIRGFLI